MTNPCPTMRNPCGFSVESMLNQVFLNPGEKLLRVSKNHAATSVCLLDLPLQNSFWNWAMMFFFVMKILVCPKLVWNTSWMALYNVVFTNLLIEATGEVEFAIFPTQFHNGSMYSAMLPSMKICLKKPTQSLWNWSLEITVVASESSDIFVRVNREIFE